MKLQTYDAILAMAVIALVLVTTLAVDQRNIIRCHERRIQELCDLCNQQALTIMDLRDAIQKQAAKK